MDEWTTAYLAAAAELDRAIDSGSETPEQIAVRRARLHELLAKRDALAVEEDIKHGFVRREDFDSAMRQRTRQRLELADAPLMLGSWLRPERPLAVSSMPYPVLKPEPRSRRAKFKPPSLDKPKPQEAQSLTAEVAAQLQALITQWETKK
jgi:hypothetical protein